MTRKMKHLLLLSTLLFTVTISSPSHAEWKMVYPDSFGGGTYVDVEGVKKDGEYVYFWQLTDLSRPYKNTEFLSLKIYFQSDCGVYVRGAKPLDISFHKERMGGGTGVNQKPPDQWQIATPDSIMWRVIGAACGE
ncbi:MAG: surface-adhesin E family protein [Sneathiella sp.]